MIGAQPEPATERGGADRLDERQLLPRHSRGDHEAFPQLVAEYRAPVYSYLGRCGLPPEERDDLFQEIFLKIHRAAGSYRSDRPLHPWIFTVVANTVRNHFRGRRVRELLKGRGRDRGREGAWEAVDRAPDGERRAEARETAAWLQGQIHGLPSNQRQVLILACVEGLTLGKVSEVLEMPLNTVKSCLRRARLTLTGALMGRRQTRPAEESS